MAGAPRGMEPDGAMKRVSRAQDGRWHYETRLDRVSDSAQFLRKTLRKFVSRWLTGVPLADFELAVGEALANCAEHGAGATMAVELWCHGDKIVVDVSDEGHGFDPPPVAAPHAGSTRGFGLYIMYELMDSVQFLDRGRTVRLERRLNGLEQARYQSDR